MTGGALQVRGLRVEFGGREVLDAVDMDVDRGELVGLIGPNGAGKTTLLRSILGLVRPASGRIAVDGRRARAGRAAVGYVPQRHDVAWDFPISVADTVMTGLVTRIGMFRRPRASHWELVADALDRVRMTGLADRPIGQLSGGQRQRVLVARALVVQPTVLLLDEPFTGLDMPTQEMLGRLFVNLAHEGRAVVMTTHDLVGALDSCDRIVLLNRSIVSAGTAAELAAEPELWTRTFGVSAESTLVRMLKAVAA